MKPRDLGSANLRDNNLILKGMANRQELQSSNRELLKQVRECLRILTANCEKLCDNLGEANGNDKRKSSAA